MRQDYAIFCLHNALWTILRQIIELHQSALWFLEANFLAKIHILDSLYMDFFCKWNASRYTNEEDHMHIFLFSFHFYSLSAFIFRRSSEVFVPIQLLFIFGRVLVNIK